MRGFVDYDHAWVDCDMIVQAFERVSNEYAVEADHSCTALCSPLLSTSAYWVSTPAYCDMLQVDALSFSLLRILLFGLYVFDFFAFFVSSSSYAAWPARQRESNHIYE